MWLLIVVALSSIPEYNFAKGSLQVKFNTQEECNEAKEQFKNIKGKNYRVSASCIFKGNN